jgi:hypothetical protein
MVEGGKKNKNKILILFQMPQNKFLYLFSFCSFPERRARETSNNKSLALTLHFFSFFFFSII